MSCKYCQTEETYYDDYGAKAVLGEGNPGERVLLVNSDGIWAGVAVTHCPWCGDDLREHGGTRWHELFGSPEKAARTLQGFDPSQKCHDCMFREDCVTVKGPCYYENQDALIEWLEGASE